MHAAAERVDDRAFATASSPPDAAATAVASATRVLVRATTLDARTVAFAKMLESASGCAVSVVLDQRHAVRDPAGCDVIAIDENKLRGVGLHCPPEFAWQCGDYAYYAARQRYPDLRWFWLIEYDVRITGGSPDAFFAFFHAHPEVDLLAAELGPVGWDWYWSLAARARDAVPHRCFFPVTRMSARAIDRVFVKRVEHSRNPLRRALWPNDEAMVATTLADGFVCRDLNSFGVRYYDSATFSVGEPLDGDALDDHLPPDAAAGESRLMHPVLYGATLQDKRAKLSRYQARDPLAKRQARRLFAFLNGRTRW